MQSELRAISPSMTESVTLARPETSRPGNRFNDGKCDRKGRLWAGTLAIDTTPGQGSLWRLDPGGKVHEMDRGFHVSNGLGWSPDDRLSTSPTPRSRRSMSTISTARPGPSRTAASS